MHTPQQHTHWHTARILAYAVSTSHGASWTASRFTHICVRSGVEELTASRMLWTEPRTISALRRSGSSLTIWDSIGSCWLSSDR
eukprot:2032835-Rhodomonas_salina.2